MKILGSHISKIIPFLLGLTLTFALPALAGDVGGGGRKAFELTDDEKEYLLKARNQNERYQRWEEILSDQRREREIKQAVFDTHIAPQLRDQ